MRIPIQRIKGFTLLELLVVVSLLAIMASVALLSNEGVGDQAELDATKYEMMELRKALLQFKRDVGAFPPAPVAELFQLSRYSNSAVTALGDTYPLWDQDAHRGWNGPYVSGDVYALKDAWYDPNNTPPTHDYELMNPHLTNTPQTQWCDAAGNVCQALQDAVHYVPDNGVRLVSYGQNGVYEGDNHSNICEKFNADSDDLVLCLLR